MAHRSGHAARGFRRSGGKGVEELHEGLDGGAALAWLDAAQAVQEVALPGLEMARALPHRGGHIIGAADQQPLAEDLGEKAEDGEAGPGLAVHVARDRARIDMQFDGGSGLLPAGTGEEPQKFLVEIVHVQKEFTRPPFGVQQFGAQKDCIRQQKMLQG